MRIAELRKEDRPREKLIQKGQKALSDIELLQIVVGSGVAGSDVVAISKKIKKLLDLHGYELTIEQLESIKGVSHATATKLVALFELAVRKIYKDAAINSTEDAIALVPELRDLKQEHLVVLSLDGANRLIAKRTISIGTLNSSLIHPREVFADPITDRAASIILIHNHPSSDSRPSEEDVIVTDRIKQSGNLLGIKLKFHIIVSKESQATIK